MSLAEILEGIEPVIEHELEVLVGIIMGSPSPAEAVARAQRAVLADAADAVTDEALRKALKGSG